jgi:hypothetical protein
MPTSPARTARSVLSLCVSVGACAPAPPAVAPSTSPPPEASTEQAKHQGEIRDEPPPTQRERPPTAQPEAAKLVMTTTVDRFVGDAPPGKVAQDIADATDGPLNECRAALVDRYSSARGKLSISFDIEADGSTKDVRAVADEIDDERFLSCVLAALAQAELPATDAGRAVFELQLLDEAEMRGGVVGAIRGPAPEQSPE